MAIVGTNTYLDVGVQRIGEYLTRVPRLRELRNASAKISAATDTAGGLLAGLPVSLNDETGQADGVVHLVLNGGADPREVAAEMLARLRRELAGAQLAASWATATDYSVAFQAMHAPGHADSLVWLPSTNEFPLARPCGGRATTSSDQADRGCGARPGMSPGHVATLCPDCRGRSQGGGQDKESRAERLLADLGKRPTEISKLCPSGRPPMSNHVATIAMDGNGVGGLFAGLMETGTAEERQKVSKALSIATEQAFQEAAYVTMRGGTVNVIPVVLGGDDLIVIVAAVDAWKFARQVVTSFATGVAAKLGEDKARGLSVSAGITFHKVKHPITAAIQTSDALMRRAKKEHTGGQAAFSWIDLTSDALEEAASPAAGLARRPVATAAALDAQADQLAELARFPESALANLRGTIDELDHLPMTDQDRRSYVLAQAARIGAEAAVAPFRYPDTGGGLPLATALDLARWWR